MRLNTLKPAPGAHKPKRRVGRGWGSGIGKNGGHGNKGQKSRGRGKVAIGFEGGQMPLQRRLPKRGFVSMTKADAAQVRLADLMRLEGGQVDLLTLKQAGLIPMHALSAKVFLKGEVHRAFTLVGVAATAGAKAAILAAGGNFSEAPAE